MAVDLNLCVQGYVVPAYLDLQTCNIIGTGTTGSHVWYKSMVGNAYDPPKTTLASALNNQVRTSKV